MNLEGGTGRGYRSNKVAVADPNNQFLQEGPHSNIPGRKLHQDPSVGCNHNLHNDKLLRKVEFLLPLPMCR